MLCALLSPFSLFRPPHLFGFLAALSLIPLGVGHDGRDLFCHIVPLHGVLPGVLAQRRGQHTAAMVNHLRRGVGVSGPLNIVTHDLKRLVNLCRLLVKQAVHLTGAVVVGGVPALFDLDAQSLSVSHLLQSPCVLCTGKGCDGVAHGPVNLCISHAVYGLHGDVVDALALHNALHDVAIEYPGVIGAVALALDALVGHHAGVLLQQELDRFGVVQGQPERHACGLFQLVESPVCAKGKDAVLLVPGQLVGRLLGCGAGLRDAVQLGVHQIRLKDLILQPDAVIILGDLACIQLRPLALVQLLIFCKKLGQLLLHLPAGSAVHPEDAPAQAVQLACRDAVTVGHKRITSSAMLMINELTPQPKKKPKTAAQISRFICSIFFLLVHGLPCCALNHQRSLGLLLLFRGQVGQQINCHVLPDDRGLGDHRCDLFSCVGDFAAVKCRHSVVKASQCADLPDERLYLRLEVVCVLVQRFIGCIQMVVGAVRADTMHIKTAEVLIHPGVEQLQKSLPGRHRDLGGVGGDLAALAGVCACNVVQIQLDKELLQLGIGHAVKVLAQPVNLRKVLQVVAEAGHHQIGVVDVGFQAHKGALVQVGTPQRHNGKSAVVFSLHAFQPAAGCGDGHALVCLLRRCLLHHISDFAFRVLGEAVQLVQDIVHIRVRIQPPEAHTRLQKACLFIVQGREFGQLENNQMVAVPEAKTLAVDQGEISGLLDLLVKVLPQPVLVHAIVRKDHAVSEGVGCPLLVEPPENITLDHIGVWGVLLGVFGQAFQHQSVSLCEAFSPRVFLGIVQVGVQRHLVRSGTAVLLHEAPDKIRLFPGGLRLLEGLVCVYSAQNQSLSFTRRFVRTK
nr:MAG TPA: hypothetical protein [Caudoviricetes sp.]